MQHIILGFGYCGYYLAKKLLANNERVVAISRSQTFSISHENFQHINFDVGLNLNSATFSDDSILYYLIPPQQKGQQDELLKKFVNNLKIRPNKIIYFGSSGVYGNSNGQWIDETTEIKPQSDRQFRRAHAELTLHQFCDKHEISLALLRVSGIYGPDRIPLEKIMNNKPIINQQQAPNINLVYVNDLVEIAKRLALLLTGIEIFNISDGHAYKMGYSLIMLAKILNKPMPEEIEYDEFYKKASPMMREFLSSSKRLNNQKILSYLTDFKFVNLEFGLQQALKYSVNQLV